MSICRLIRSPSIVCKAAEAPWSCSNCTPETALTFILKSISSLVILWKLCYSSMSVYGKLTHEHTSSWIFSSFSIKQHSSLRINFRFRSKSVIFLAIMIYHLLQFNDNVYLNNSLQDHRIVSWKKNMFQVISFTPIIQRFNHFACWEDAVGSYII